MPLAIRDFMRVARGAAVRAMLALAVGAPALGAQAAPGAPATAGESPKRSPVYLVLSLDAYSGRILTGEGGNGDETSAALGSLDFSIQSARSSGVGLALRTVGGDAYEQAELGLLLGSRLFAFELGAASRTGYNVLTDILNDTTYRFARAGVRTRVNLADSDFSLTFRAARYINIPSATDRAFPSELTGFGAETGLSWTWARWPVTANLGYRLDRFVVHEVEQETSALTLGAGILLGRR